MGLEVKVDIAKSEGLFIGLLESQGQNRTTVREKRG